MNRLSKLLAVALLVPVSVQADVVVRELPDTSPGKGYGGLTGFMVGAVGGPVGALVGAGVGWLVGGKSQQALGLEGQAYEVAAENGAPQTVRSPNTIFAPGDEVIVENGRLRRPAFDGLMTIHR